MRTNLTTLVAGFLLALIFNSGPIGTLAYLVFLLVLASGLAGVRWRVEVIHATSGASALGRVAAAFAGVLALVLAAGYVWAVMIRDQSIRIDSPGWIFWGLLPLLGALLLWAAWSPTPREAPTTEEAVADGLRDFVDRNRGL